MRDERTGSSAWNRTQSRRGGRSRSGKRASRRLGRDHGSNHPTRSTLLLSQPDAENEPTVEVTSRLVCGRFSLGRATRGCAKLRVRHAGVKPSPEVQLAPQRDHRAQTRTRVPARAERGRHCQPRQIRSTDKRRRIALCGLPLSSRSHLFMPVGLPVCCSNAMNSLVAPRPLC